jgi:hypothetical protein
MLIATFNEKTGWQGRAITREGDALLLEGHGPITAPGIMGYDRQSQLTWAGDGMRAWVQGLASGTPPAPPTPQPTVAAPLTAPPLGAPPLGAPPLGAVLNDKLIWWAALSPLWLWLLIPLSAVLFLGFGVGLVPFIFLMVDWEDVKKAGVESRWLVLWALFLPPGYIFVRQRRAHRSLTPFFVSAVLWFFPIVTSLTTVWMTISGS